MSVGVDSEFREAFTDINDSVVISKRNNDGVVHRLAMTTAS